MKIQVVSRSVEGFNSLEQFVSSDGGVLLLDKYIEWTSFDVVKKVRSMLQVKKVGHAGTLDPLATGLLILCSNKMTKTIDTYQQEEKEYTGVFTLGAVTESYDTATNIQFVSMPDTVSDDMIRTNTQRYVGKISQIPPMYSAVKVGGKRLYTHARKGNVIERKPREVTVTSFDIWKIEKPDVYFTVICSKGTYVRTLVHDFGQDLRCGAYLKNLRRTRIGEYHVDDAWTIDSIKKAIEN